MRVLVFGNPIARGDTAAVKAARLLEGKIKGIEFVRFDTAEDLENEGTKLVIMDAVVGLRTPRKVELDELELPDRPLSLHGFDLLWNLLLLKKLGKIRKATIIGVPAGMALKSIVPKVRRLLLGILKGN